VRVTLIHNPGAGKQAKNEAKKLLGIVRAAGHKVRYQSAKSEDWAAALAEDADLIAVAGGDGTVSRVAKRMVGRSIPIAALPLGTANNISRTLGIIDLDVKALVRGWPEARRVKLDVGIAEGPWGKRYFVEGIGVGLFTCLLSRQKPDAKLARIKRPDKRVARALELLKERVKDCPPIEIEAKLDGKTVAGRYLLLEALSILYVGPNLFLAPDSQPGDGRFDLVMVTEAERDRLLEYLSKWQENKERLAVLPSQRGQRLTMAWDGFEIHIDDQLWPEKKSRRKRSEIDVRIEGAAVDFLAPGRKEAEKEPKTRRGSRTK
jgi:diacylglycerol kinase family enzyme